MYGIYCLVIFFTTIIATYGALSEIIEHGATYKEVGLFVIVFYCMGLLFVICNEAHHASRRVSRVVFDLLEGIYNSINASMYRRAQSTSEVGSVKLFGPFFLTKNLEMLD